MHSKDKFRVNSESRLDTRVDFLFHDPDCAPLAMVVKAMFLFWKTAARAVQDTFIEIRKPATARLTQRFARRALPTDVVISQTKVSL